MDLNDIATKADLQEMERRLVELISKGEREGVIPSVVTSERAKEIMGGISDDFLRKLRIDGVLNAKKIGSIYFYNVDQIISILPKFPDNEVQQTTEKASSKRGRKSTKLF